MGPSSHPAPTGTSHYGLLLWAIREQRDMAYHLRPVFTALATYAQADGAGAWPSVATLADVLGVDRRTVQRHLRALEAEGFVRAVGPRPHGRMDRRPVTYALVLERGGATVTPLRHGAAQVARRGGTGCTNGAAPTPPELALRTTHEQARAYEVAREAHELTCHRMGIPADWYPFRG